MNISSSFNIPQNPNNSLSFKGQRLFQPITLAKTLFTMEKVPIESHFTRLEREDVFELFKNRSELAKSEYGLFILRDLIRKLQKKDWGTDFFMIDAPAETYPYRKIKGLASIFTGRHWTEIINLQTLKEYDDSIRGVCSRLVQGICKLARDKKHTHVELDAAGEHLFDFYRNLGFRQAANNPHRFYLTDQDYDNFINNIDNKYSIETICAQN